MSEPGLGRIHADVLDALRSPSPRHLAALAGLAAVAGWAWLVWIWQVRTGMGVAGINHPVGWGVYIANFVFWVGIAHSGTLISAILFLVRARWRDSVSRSSEAMTVFAVMTAGLFPLVHLGRLWVFYFILPYPSQRQIWPNFSSPLVWDVLAVTTYFIVSLIFFSVGLIPDLAAARDRAESRLGPDHWRSRLYRTLALGWSGAGSQWRHWGRGYLYFAALATPLVISVHSVVSWDFAVSLLPGWHTTIYAPYFVAGAIHSGLAMVLTLLIPMRRLLHLEEIIEARHLRMVAQTMLVTTGIIAYAYVVEPFIAWYSGDVFEAQFVAWRAFAFDDPMTWVYWSLVLLNVLAPLSFAFSRVRRSLPALFVVSILVNVGMWLERVHLVTASTAHDFLPHNWGHYGPSWVEGSITLGSFAFFFLLFLAFTRLLPTVPVAELKEQVVGEGLAEPEPRPARPRPPDPRAAHMVRAVFAGPEQLLEAVKATCEAGFDRLETFSPVKLRKVLAVLGQDRSPVRRWTLIGALSGLVGGYALAITTALVNGLVVGGKPPVAPIPYAIVAFEGTILLGALANLAGLLVHARLVHRRTRPGYDRRFGVDRFGLVVSAADDREAGEIRALLERAHAEEIDVLAG